MELYLGGDDFSGNFKWNDVLKFWKIGPEIGGGRCGVGSKFIFGLPCCHHEQVNITNKYAKQRLKYTKAKILVSFAIIDSACHTKGVVVHNKDQLFFQVI